MATVLFAFWLLSCGFALGLFLGSEKSHDEEPDRKALKKMVLIRLYSDRLEYIRDWKRFDPSPETSKNYRDGLKDQDILIRIVEKHM